MNETERKLKCIACHNPRALISLKRRSLRNNEHNKRLKFIDPLNVCAKCVVVECQNIVLHNYPRTRKVRARLRPNADMDPRGAPSLLPTRTGH